EDMLCSVAMVKTDLCSSEEMINGKDEGIGSDDILSMKTFIL
ncbi:13976_t:CDS:1, partial [Funneliformis geosporum]